jgi:hypothetical protein
VRNGLKKYYRIFICEKIKRETLEALVNFGKIKQVETYMKEILLNYLIPKGNHQKSQLQLLVQNFPCQADTQYHQVLSGKGF